MKLLFLDISTRLENLLIRQIAIILSMTLFLFPAKKLNTTFTSRKDGNENQMNSPWFFFDLKVLELDVFRLSLAIAFLLFSFKYSC